MSTKQAQQTKQAVHETVLQNENIQEKIRTIVTQALSQGTMEPEEIRQTLKDVVEEACTTVDDYSKGSGDAIKQVITGVDAALTQAAGATKLAIEEASSNVQEFSDHDLKQALNDLQDLETLFFDVLRDVTEQSKENSRKTVNELLNHLQASGSAVGRSVEEILKSLQQEFAQSGRLQKIHAADVAKAAGTMFARVSSGILGGIADSLNPDKK